MKKYLKEWADKIDELSGKEKELIQLKEDYETESDKLLDEAAKIKNETGEDIIKNMYGRNNDKTRRKYIKEQLANKNKEIIDCELRIDYLKRRISFLKGLVNYMGNVQ